jgi:hypothetical protein
LISTSSRSVVTGAGLWTTRRIVGKPPRPIRVRSLPGCGTVFCIFLLIYATAGTAV